MGEKTIIELRKRMKAMRVDLTRGANKELVKAYDVGVDATIRELKDILKIYADI